MLVNKIDLIVKLIHLITFPKNEHNLFNARQKE